MWPFKAKQKPSRIDPDAPRVVIIGNGITGISAAIQIRKNQPTWQISIVSGESAYFYSRPALMYIFMGHMRFEDTKPYDDRFWETNEINRIQAWAISLNSQRQTVGLDTGQDLPYDKLLIATGSKPNYFGWPGQDLKQVQGLYTLQDLTKLESSMSRINTAVVVGGGLIGIELAEMLVSRGRKVSILARENEYWDNVLPTEEAKMVGRVIREHHVDLRLNTELAQIEGDENQNVTGVELKNGERIECEFVGLTAGVSPNIDLLRVSEVETERGVLVNKSFHTTVRNIFAAGDCAEIIVPNVERNTIEQLWYTGKMQGEVVGDIMSGTHRSYERGVWYNSAKFFDLEYHTYGQVPSAQSKHGDELQQYWWSDEHRRGLRLVFDSKNKIVGMNALGIRHHHKTWERWITEERDQEYVFSNLHRAEFDPEFYEQVSARMVESFKESSSK